MNSKLENILKRIGKTAVKAALPVIAATCFLMPKEIKGIAMDGFFINAPNCSVKVYRKPTGPIDTLRTQTNVFGKYGIATENFNPPAQTGETLYVYGGWNLGGEARTYMIRGPPEYNSLDLNLNKHTACIKDVYDLTNFNAPLKLIYWINGFAPETTQVDTGFSWYWKYDVHAPFNKAQATHGAQAHFRFEKVRGDTTFYRNIDFLIDTTRFDAQLVKDTIYFTKDSSIIGIAEENQKKNIEQKFDVYPTITNGHVNVKGANKINVYDISGRKAGHYEGNATSNGFNFEMSAPAGVYFIKPEENSLPTRKVVKTE